ncbi:probable receptor-like protein kinase At2g23200 [Rutidosis leptorrhynchoides]|uniref:probable receptor-like protein kinase At2g23200 n=1 Tax=Rutidosis leptorrhynchoides TaxID=125765 RepID=UPI003A999DE1
MASSIAGIAHLQISLQKILTATNNFSDKNIIGKGGFGNVYRGKLEHDGKMIKIAARRLDRKYGYGDVEFRKEVSALSSLQDTGGIVSMIGFCDEKGEKVIVNQHYRKGSLVMYINGPNGPSFTWKQRLTIAEYLFMAILTIHSDIGKEYIIHRNINSSTILLDDHRWPILSGFEFSIKIPMEQKKRVILSEVIGTKGYIDPAIEKYGGVTYKSDIYSVGVILFELICGRKAFEENRLLAPLAKFHYENGTLKDIIHPDLLDQVEPKLLNKFSQIAYSCLEDDPALRPDAEELLEQVVIPDLVLKVSCFRCVRLEESPDVTINDRLPEGTAVWQWRRTPYGRAMGEFDSLLSLLASYAPDRDNPDNWKWSMASDGLFKVNPCC